MWIGTFGGLSRFDGAEFVNWTKEDDGLLDNRVYNLFREPGGIIWLCTAKGVSRYDPSASQAGVKKFKNFTAADGLVGGQIDAVCRTPDGAMWFGFRGLSRYDGSKFVTFTSKDGAPKWINKMASSSDGVLWLAGDRGFWRDGTNFVNPVKRKTGNSLGDTPLVARDGTVWFGSTWSGRRLALRWKQIRQFHERWLLNDWSIRSMSH
jgi:ligand-binding sensor domain-containing protein